MAMAEWLAAAKGEKRGRYYTAAPPVMAIRHRVAEPKLISDPFGEPPTSD
jgi:hypothetical protein